MKRKLFFIKIRYGASGDAFGDSLLCNEYAMEPDYARGRG